MNSLLHNKGLRALITAFVFLTRLPMPTLPDYRPQDAGRAFSLFPLVGLMLGLILSGTAHVMNEALPATVTAAVLVALWAALTGGLHLDGLGDSADGWLAGGDRQRTLEIMKDPRSGSAAVIAIVCVLLLKFAALQALISTQQWWVIALTPMLTRAAALGLMLSTDYVSESGIATDFLQHASVSSMCLAILISLLLSGWLLPLEQMLWLLVTGLLIWLAVRHMMCRRLGGSTGDTTGASIEVLEAVILTAALLG